LLDLTSSEVVTIACSNAGSGFFSQTESKSNQKTSKPQKKNAVDVQIFSVYPKNP